MEKLNFKSIDNGSEMEDIIAEHMPKISWTLMISIANERNPVRHWQMQV